MDLIDRLNQLASKVAKQKDSIATEEATKTAFILPLIAALGYDVFDPDEVIPEAIADIGMKVGEKVDYAIAVNGKVSMVIECKMVDAKLDVSHEGQLQRYFNNSEARIGVLTDGIIYRFYTDLDKPNVMDNNPFLEFSVSKIDEIIVSELKKFTKAAFNIDELLSSASELKYTKAIKSIINEQLTTPSDEFLKFLLSNIYAGRVTAQVKEQFVPIITKAFQQLINDKLNDRLKSALSIAEPSTPTPVEQTQNQQSTDESKATTAQEDLEGFYIVKSILNDVVDLKRVTYRPAQAYFNILLDDNNRKPIVRLYLHGSKNYIGVFDTDKKEEKIPVTSIDDIYEHREKIVASAKNYLTQA